MAVEELARKEGFRVGHVGPLLISVFHDYASAERLRELERVQDLFVQKHPKVLSFTVVKGDRLRAPDADVRALSSRLQAKYESVNVASVTVITVKGLGAIVARSFMAALALMAPSSRPIHTFKTIREAVEWAQALPGQLPEVVAAKDLAQQLEDFSRF